MSNRNLSLKELALLRRKAVEAVIKEGLTQAKSARLFDFTKASMSKYIKEYKLTGEASFVYKRRGIKLSKPRYLTEEQCQGLIETLLTKTPDEVGLHYTLWNSLAIQNLIALKFSVHYSDRGIRQLMQNLGFSSQKPIKKAYQQNQDKLVSWLTDIYPAIK